ncbi:MAG: hypothetical protein KL840_14295 [Aquamicrobium sp.]|nr:hypothetical protein [Aquamicrobium sp.]
MTQSERFTIVFDARIAEFERAIEERFKPALRNAIGDVLAEFMEGLPDPVVVTPDTPPHYSEPTEFGRREAEGE